MLSLLLFANNVTCKSVHELLSSLLPHFKLVLPIGLLLIQELCILGLCLDIGSLLSHLIAFCLDLVGFVLLEHFLEILFFLSPLLSLHGLLHLHLFPQSLHQLNFKLECLLFFFAFPNLLFLELPVPALLLLHNLFPNCLVLLCFSLAKEFHVLLSKGLVHSSLLLLGLGSSLLLRNLSIKFLLDQPSSLLLSCNSLLLLFVVQQSIEFLDGCPLVLFRQLAVNLSSLGDLARSNAHLVALSPSRVNAVRLGAASGTSN